MASEIFNLFGSISLKGANNVTSELAQVDKAGQKTGTNMDKTNQQTGKSATGLAGRVGQTYTSMVGHVSRFAQSSAQNLGRVGANMQRTGQSMMQFGNVGKVALGAVGVSAGGMGIAVASGMKRLDALNQANMIFQSFNAAGDKSFGGVTKAASDMTKGTTMSIGEFGKSVDKYVKKGVPEAAAIATTSLNAFTKGTSVGMTDAATSTAKFNSVGMDLKQSTNTFKDMTKVLAGTGHATTEHMGRASDAISQMAAAGKVDLGAMNQLMVSMPDSLKMLADSNNMSIGDMRKAITDGKVSYEDFAKAMTGRAEEVDKAFEKQGGVMAQTGKSFEGTIGNLKSAVARFGATILESIGQENITSAIGNIGKKLDELGTKVGPIIKDFAEFSIKAWDMIKPFVPMIASFVSASAGMYAMGSVLDKVGGLFTVFSKNPILSMLTLLAALFIKNYTQSETFRNTVDGLVSVFGGVMSILSPVINLLGSFVEWLANGDGAASVLRTGLLGVVGALTAFMAIGKAVEMIKAFKTAVMASTAVTKTWELATKAAAGAQKLFNLAMNANPIMKIITVITALVGVLIWFFTQTETGRNMWQGFMDWLKSAWEGISSFFQGLWDGIVGIFNAAVEFIGNFLSSTWGQVILFIINPFAGIINAVIQNWDKIKEIFHTTVGAIIDFMKSSWDFMKSVVEVTMNIIWSIVQIGWQLIKLVFDFFVGGIVAFVKWSFELMSNIINAVMEVIKGIIETVWGFIEPYVTAVVEGIRNVIDTAWNWIKTTTESVFNGIKDFISVVWEAIKTYIVEPVMAVATKIFETWMSILNKTREVFNAIGQFAGVVWNKIKDVITTVVTAIVNKVTQIWNKIKDVTTNVFNAVKNFVINVWNAIKEKITSVVNAIKDKVTQIWNGIKSVTSSVFNAVKGVVTNVWNSIKDKISNVVDGVKNSVSNAWNNVKTVTSNIFNGVKNKISEIWNGIWDTIKGVVDKIKGAFNFDLKFPKIEIPHIPMPHFKMSGSFNPLKGQIPSVGIDWYAKGGIMTKPTIFGMNGNTMMGGGEAGKEAVLPLNDKTLGGIGAGIADQMKRNNQEVSEATTVFSGDVNINISGVDGITSEVLKQIQDAVEEGITRKQNARSRTIGGFA